jgi:hypothetical protein
MTDSRATACRVIFCRWAEYALRAACILCATHEEEGRLRYGGGGGMLWSAMHGREYTPVALLIPTRAFLRTRDEAKTRRSRRTASALFLRDTQVGGLSRRPFLRFDLFSFFSRLLRFSRKSCVAATISAVSACNIFGFASYRVCVAKYCVTISSLSPTLTTN